MSPQPSRLAILIVRHGIDRVDDGILHLAAARRALVQWLVPLKRRAGSAPRDAVREQVVRFRAQVLAHRLHLPCATAEELLDVLIRDACVQQGLAATLPGDHAMQPTLAPLDADAVDRAGPTRLLRWLPPPARLAPLTRLVPRALQARALERALARVLAHVVRTDAFAFLEGRRIGIEASDLGVRWVFVRRDGALHVVDEPAEATVRGSVTDLLLLASRLDDADTLFFHRRLILTGDTELGLTARNVLDRLPWEAIPLGARILLNRLARFARRARDAYRAAAAPGNKPRPAAP